MEPAEPASAAAEAGGGGRERVGRGRAARGGARGPAAAGDPQPGVGGAQRHLLAEPGIGLGVRSEGAEPFTGAQKGAWDINLPFLTQSP